MRAHQPVLLRGRKDDHQRAVTDLELVLLRPCRDVPGDRARRKSVLAMSQEGSATSHGASAASYVGSATSRIGSTTSRDGYAMSHDGSDTSHVGSAFAGRSSWSASKFQLTTSKSLPSELHRDGHIGAVVGATAADVHRVDVHGHHDRAAGVAGLPVRVPNANRHRRQVGATNMCVSHSLLMVHVAHIKYLALKQSD